MSTAILAVLLLMLACIVLSSLAATVYLLVALWRWARRTDTYEPAAAEAPLVCGCDDTGVRYSCMHCMAARCHQHRSDPHECVTGAAFADVQKVLAGQFDADGDLLPQGTPRVVAGSDLDGSGLMSEVYEAIDLYRRGEAIERDAPRERP